MELDEVCEGDLQHYREAEDEDDTHFAEDTPHSVVFGCVLCHLHEYVPNLRYCGRHNNDQAAIDIHEQLDEELPVVEADTIVNPWAVMIHVQNAPIAYAAVVSSVRFPHITHLAIPSSFGFIAHVESPVGRHQARICHDALVERCQQVEEQQMIHEEAKNCSAVP